MCHFHYFCLKAAVVGLNASLLIILSRISQIFQPIFLHSLLFKNNSHLFLRRYISIRNTRFRTVESHGAKSVMLTARRQQDTAWLLN